MSTLKSIIGKTFLAVLTLFLLHSISNSAEISVNNSNHTQNKTETHAISGMITHNDKPLAGVTIWLSGAYQQKTVTDKSGKYKFAKLPTTDNLTITPVKKGFTFTPPSINTSYYPASKIIKENEPILFKAKSSHADLGAKWTLRTSNDRLSRVIWGKDKFVAVDIIGQIYTSTDTIEWTPRLQMADRMKHIPGISDIAWFENMFIAVGTGGIIYTSPDGIDWTFRKISSSMGYIFSIAWSGNRFVIVGTNGSVYTSTDGIKWESNQIAAKTVLMSVIWSGTQFVAVGMPFFIATSPDGLTWTTRMSPQSPGIPPNYSLHSVTHSKDRLIAVGIGPSKGIIFTSDDNGISWSERNSGITYPISKVFRVGEQFVALCGNTQPNDDNACYALISKDGINWTKQMTKDLRYSQPAWSGSIYAAIKNNGISTSHDGIRWTRKNLLRGDDLSAIARSDAKFVAIGNGGLAVYSPDGIIWSNNYMNTGGWQQSLVWTGSEFIAAGSLGGTSGIIAVSADGINWTKNNSYIQSPLNGISKVREQLIAVSSRGDIFYSKDGVKWSISFFGDGQPLYAVAGNHLTTIAVGGNGKMLKSNDNVTWTSEPSGITGNIYSITWSGINFTAVGEKGLIITSPDGTNWEKISSDINTDLYSVLWTGERYIAVGDHGVIITSYDGTEWVRHESETDYALRGIEANESQYVIVGDNRTIITSP